MKKLTSKLSLKRETLRQLGENQLLGAAGGSAADTHFQCNPTFLSVACSTVP